jgi:hypothetical protein
MASRRASTRCELCSVVDGTAYDFHAVRVCSVCGRMLKAMVAWSRAMAPEVPCDVPGYVRGLRCGYEAATGKKLSRKNPLTN